MKLIEHSDECFIFDAKLMRQTNTLPKMKNSEEYIIICIHFLAWGIVLDLRKEIAKKLNARNS